MEHTEKNLSVIAGKNLETLVFQRDNKITVRLKNREGKFLSDTEIPLIEMEIYDRMQERADWVFNYRIIACEQHDERTLHIIIRSPDHALTLGLWLRITDNDELSVILPPIEIDEARRDLFRIYSARLLPGILTVSGKGRAFLPITSGLVFNPAGLPAMRDRFLIYGEQSRWELLPTMPLCATTMPDTGGWIALAVQGACDMYCEVNVDGRGVATTGLHPMFRREWIDAVDWTEREVCFQPLNPDADMIHMAAARLRKHVVEDHGKPTLEERAAESPVCAYQQSAYTMKLFHGIQRQGIMMRGREGSAEGSFYQRTLSFAAAEDGMRRLKKAGIERILFQSVGWNARGHDGAWPTDFPVDRRLGGEEGFRAMINTAKQLGFQITTHLNMVMACFSSPDFKTDKVIYDIWGEPKVVGEWGGGIHGAHWGLAIPEADIRQRMEAVQALGLNGMQYLDGMGNPLYVNYHPQHAGPRSHFAAGVNRFLDIARDITGGVETEMGFLYCALHADALAAGPGGAWHLNGAKPEWPITSLIKAGETVPVWHLALHGLVTMENQNISWPGTMKAVLFGEVPRDEWAMEGLFPVLDDARVACLKARYDLCCERFSRLVREPLVRWQRLDDQVEETQFADGTIVLADFASGKLQVNGEDIPQPAAFQNAK